MHKGYIFVIMCVMFPVSLACNFYSESTGNGIYIYHIQYFLGIKILMLETIQCSNKNSLV